MDVSGALLDTSVLIGPAGAVELPAAAAISVITLGELRAGVLLAREAGVEKWRQDRFDAVRAAFEPLLVDEDVAEKYADVLAVARTEGRTVKATDLLIIATAAAAGRVLYTLDEKQQRLAESAGLDVVGADTHDPT